MILWSLTLMDTDLINTAVGLQQAKLAGEIQVRVAKKILDAASQQGSTAVRLIDAASQNMNKAGDALVAAATGLGGQIDVAA